MRSSPIVVIVPKGDRTTEREASTAVIAFLRTRAYGEADLKTLFFHLPSWIKLTAADREGSNSRIGDQKWHAAVRNIAAHADQPGNAIFDGLLLKRRGGGYRLPSKKPATPSNTLDQYGG
jgi:hypothetical protein